MWLLVVRLKLFSEQLEFSRQESSGCPNQEAIRILAVGRARGASQVRAVKFYDVGGVYCVFFLGIESWKVHLESCSVTADIARAVLVLKVFEGYAKEI